MSEKSSKGEFNLWLVLLSCFGKLLISFAMLVENAINCSLSYQPCSLQGVLLNTAKDDKGPQIDELNTSR